MRRFKSGDVHLRAQAVLYLRRIRAFKKELDGFLQVCHRLFDCLSLAGYIKFGAERDELGVFALEYSGQGYGLVAI